MKQKLFGAAALVAFILFGASCSKEQSELKLSSIKQQIEISATVTYSTGVDVNATTYSVINNKPAAGRKVFIDVPFAQYQIAAAATAGTKVYETVTDENGKFSISIPTKSDGTAFTIRMEEFTDTYRTYEKMGADGKPVFKEELRQYSYSKAFAASMPGSLQFPEEIVYDNKKIDIDLFKESVTLAGNINLACETGFREGKFQPANKANVEFTIIYDKKPAPATNEEITFGTTTDANGNYSITIPMKSLADGFDISSIKVLGIGNSQFTHYINDTTTVKVYGAYKLASINKAIAPGTTIAFRNVIDGITYNMGEKNLLFTPYYNADITDASNAKPEEWKDNLIGWAAGMTGFDESYSQTKTLTGKVYMPKMSEYGVGYYANERQTIILTSATAPYDKGLAVITKEDGTFSVDLPVKDDASIAFTAKLAKEDQPFLFKGQKKDIEIFDGKYGTNTNIQAEDAKWFELGDFYFHYAPTTNPEGWDANLLGWYRDAKYNKPVQVKGKILFAAETSYGIGTYVAQPRLVTVTATQSGETRTFAVKANATTGAFDFMLPLKDEHDQPALAVTTENYKTNEYVHYPKYGSNETKLLAGYYTIKGGKQVYDSKDAKEAWNDLGTTFMYIQNVTGVANTGLDHTQSTYHDDLAGWFWRADNDILWSASKTATGSAKIAKETGYLAGEYVPAKGEIVTVTLYSNDATNKKDVSVLTANDGSFSVNVPLKHEGDDTELSAAGGKIKVENFIHYPYASGNTKILEGEYKGTSIKPSTAKWYEIGTVYYQFTPDNHATVNMWDDFFQYISGWVIVDGREVRNQIVNGDVRIPVETGFRAGSYAVAKKFPVKIQVGSSTPYTYYVTATDTLGHFEIPVWQKFAGDDENVSWLDPALETQKMDLTFKHFRRAGTTTYELLKGEYKAKETQEKDGAKWYEKGTRYYKFDNKSTDATLYTQDLAGWAVRPKNTQRTVYVSGTIKQAYEKVDGTQAVPGWENGGNKIYKITVKLNTTSYGPYKIATSSGNFSVQIYDTNKDLANTSQVQVTLSIDNDDETYRKAYFKTSIIHYTDHMNLGTKTSLPGEYKTIANTPGVTSPSTGSFSFDHSYKLTFTPDDPSYTGWGDYSWASKYNDEE